MIDVIIPAYNAHSFILNALLSITSQTINNLLNVYIINDYSEHDYSKEISRFKDYLNIKELKTPKNIGPGGARQYGVDNSSGKYIVFIDADDVFNDAYSIEKLYNCIDINNLNALTSNFNKETINDFRAYYYNEAWLHGKIYRRSFLEKHNIKFNNSRENEDTGFNTLISLIEENGFAYIDEFTYIWRHNENSITRKDNHQYRYTGIKGYIYNFHWACIEAEKRNCSPKKIAEKTICAMLCIYNNYIKYKSIDEENDNMILKEAKKLKKIYTNYIKYLTKEEKNEIERSIIAGIIQESEIINLLNSKVTFDDFLTLIDTQK